MQGLKSNLWSSETLVKGMSLAAAQPKEYGQVESLFQEDPDLKEAFLVTLRNIRSWKLMQVSNRNTRANLQMTRSICGQGLQI